MPVYKNEERDTYYVKLYYTDYTEDNKQKKSATSSSNEKPRSGSAFLERLQGTPDMTFQSLYDLYIKDMGHRLRQNSIDRMKCFRKKNVFKNRILPYFKDKPVNAITPTDIRAW